jgi:two-component system, NarL family, nitrate/nitrite response regulator NarL
MNAPGAPRDTPIRVMVVDDHTLFRRGLVSLLTADGRFEVVGEAGDAAQALVVVRQCQPDVLLLDNHLPGASGVDALPALLQTAPALKVLMLTMSEDEHDLAAALKGGACGYLLKTADSDELGTAIERALAGQSSVSAPMTAKLAAAFRLAGPAQPRDAVSEPPASPMHSLSSREREIAELIAQGHSNKLIARTLGIAETTVKIHVQHILRKLGVDSRVQAATWVARQAAQR